MADDPSSFLISWWYSSGTKLGLYLNDFKITHPENELLNNSMTHLNVDNGMSGSFDERYIYKNIITNHPVENSGNVSDHIIPLPNEITISGAVTALKPFAFVTSYLDFSQLGNAIQLLEQVARCRTGVSITTGLLYGNKYYRAHNLACSNLETGRNVVAGRTTVNFTMTFQQLNIVSSSGSSSSSKTAPATPTIDKGVD